MFYFETVLLIFLPIVFIEGQRLDIVTVEKYTVEPNIITREKWGARVRNRTAIALQSPVPCVIVHHTAKKSCDSQDQCMDEMKNSQNYDVDTHKWIDISYNFYVGEDGNVYEGRGWDIAGGHTTFMNEKSIGICLIGDFQKRKPKPAAIRAINNLISYGISLGKISPNYLLYARNQISRRTKSRNSKFVELVKSWPHGENYFKNDKYYIE